MQRKLHTVYVLPKENPSFASYDISHMAQQDFLSSSKPYIRSSYKERRVNALAPGAEEGRGKLRKAAERRKQPSTRRCPNGATHLR